MVKILETRMQTGELYLVFMDTVNKNMANHQRKLGMKVRTSNLCSEIMLHTGLDHHGKDRTAVCCLSSVNLEKWDEWSEETQFIEDIMRFLDNVLEDFITNAPESMKTLYILLKWRDPLVWEQWAFTVSSKERGSIRALCKSWNAKFFKHLKKEQIKHH